MTPRLKHFFKIINIIGFLGAGFLVFYIPILAAHTYLENSIMLNIQLFQTWVIFALIAVVLLKYEY